MLYLAFSEDGRCDRYEFCVEGPADRNLQVLDTEFHQELLHTPGVRRSGDVSRFAYDRLSGSIPLSVYACPTEDRYAYISRYTPDYKVAFTDWLVEKHGFTKPETDEQTLFY